MAHVVNRSSVCDFLNRHWTKLSLTASLHRYDIFLSLGFGRPHTTSSPPTCPQQYLAFVRKLGSSTHIDPTAATYVTSLAELSLVSPFRYFAPFFYTWSNPKFRLQ